MGMLHLGRQVRALGGPAHGTSSASGTAGRGIVRDPEATASSWPNRPRDEREVVAVHAVDGVESDVAARRRRADTTKKPSAPLCARALLKQRPPSRNTSTASRNASGTCNEWTIEGMLMDETGPRAGSHTPATGGGGAIGAGNTSADEDGWATKHTTTCTCARSHRPASWSSSPSGHAQGGARPSVPATAINQVTSCGTVKAAGTVPREAAGQLT